MVADNIKISEVTEDMSLAKQQAMIKKYRKASQKYVLIARLLDEAGLALDINNTKDCIAKLTEAKASLE